MLRDYQIAIAEQAKDILLQRLIVYLAIEMRVGKTLISLHTAELYGAENVLFVTKKKAIGSVMSDYEREGFPFRLTVINYEQLHNFETDYDFYIVDEAHSNGAFPKPSLRTQQLRRLVGHMPLMLLSGTASPESYSQLYHQLWISLNSPFKHANFYKWAHEFVNIKQKKINGMLLNDYGNAKRDEIMNVLNPYFISFTQAEAGFQQADVIEEIKEIDIDPRINKLVAYLLKNKYFKFKDGSELVCDSAVKLQNKVHQLFSGTVKLEDGTVKILDTSKVEYIKTAYQGMKIAIFYKFIAEGKALREALDNWTDDPDEFNNSEDKIFLSQIQSGSMGVNLATADVLIFYNIDFSSTQYWQARARLQTLNRKNAPLVHWLFAKGGIEPKIMKAVQNKKDYTNYYFKRDYMKN